MSLLTPLLFSFLPGQITHLLVPRISSALPQLLPPAPKGTPAYARNYRLVFTLVILLYVAYTFRAEGSSSSEGGDEEWYALLGVRRDADDDSLRRAFRSLSRTYHPDRAGSEHANRFILIRQAYENLASPVRRYAYDRFGPQVAPWKGETTREFVWRGVLASSGFYIVSGGLMLLLGRACPVWQLLGRAREGAFWRYTLLALLLVAELALVLGPTPLIHRSPVLDLLPHPIAVLIRPFVPARALAAPAWVQVRFLRRIFTSASVALSQLTAVWSGPAPAEDSQLLLSLAKAIELEALRAFQAEVVPVISDQRDPRPVIHSLQGKMEQVLVDRALSSYPALRDTWAKAASRSLAPFQPDAILATAAAIPLPPSPPPSPVSRPSRLPGH